MIPVSRKKDKALGASVTGRLLIGPYTEEHADEHHYDAFAPYTDVINVRPGERVLFVSSVFVDVAKRGNRSGLKLVDELSDTVNSDRDILVAQEYGQTQEGLRPGGLELYYFRSGFRRIGMTMERNPIMHRYRERARARTNAG